MPFGRKIARADSEKRSLLHNENDEGDDPNAEEKKEDKLSYFFTGKMGLFPVFILSTLVGSGILVTRGRLPYSKGYFTSSEVFYGIAGLVLFLFAVAFVASSLRWLVFKVTFSFTKDAFVVTKRGVLRTSRLEFALPITSLHYLRSHFVEEQAWLALVVQEGDIYYRIFSWRGRGNQKLRFLKLFNELRSRLDRWHSSISPSPAMSASAMYRNQGNPEIATREEVRLVSPFTMRLKSLQSGQGPWTSQDEDGSDMSEQRPQHDVAASICWEDVPAVNFDSFFHHYDFSKQLKGGLSTKTIKILSDQ